MSRSTYETLNAMATETSVPHYSKELVPHTLNPEIFPDGDTFLDGEKLEAWTREKGVMTAVLQQGIKAGIISVRAAFKTKKKNKEWTPETGQAQVDKWKWTEASKPSKKDNSAEAHKKGHMDAGYSMAMSMKKVKLANKTILAALLPVYGEDISNEIMDQIKANDQE